MAKQTYGNNIMGEVKGNKLFLEIDLSTDLGPSKSGKTQVIATTHGNASLGEVEGKKISLGLNCYFKK